MQSLASPPSDHAASAKSYCLLVRVDPVQLLVPRVLVAEVVGFHGTTLSPGAVREIKFFQWRGFRVPLVHPMVVDRRCGQALTDEGKIVIFHGLLNRARLPFHALAVSRTPRLLMLSSDMLREDARGDVEPGVLAWVRVEDEPALIPKMDHVENFILSNLQR